ncbi:MAG: hypothetical protein KatS3mg101_0250 [Patescibacteria group bacterium]|nr:MAG: hypothetical protein KatS3mg101_0250 [Patescibacteria group bacterium]
MFKFFGDPNEKQLNRIRPIVAEINSLEDSVQKLSQEKMRERVLEWKAQLRGLDYEEQEKLMRKNPSRGLCLCP